MENIYDIDVKNEQGDVVCQVRLADSYVSYEKVHANVTIKEEFRKHTISQISKLIIAYCFNHAGDFQSEGDMFSFSFPNYKEVLELLFTGVNMDSYSYTLLEYYVRIILSNMFRDFYEKGMKGSANPKVRERYIAYVKEIKQAIKTFIEDSDIRSKPYDFSDYESLKACLVAEEYKYGK